MALAHKINPLSIVAGKDIKRQVTAIRCKMSLYEFVKHSWEIIEPTTPMVDNWHIEMVCDHLQAIMYNKIKNLIICIPPGHLKSILVSVMFPAWSWLVNPGDRSLYGSYDENLVFRDSIKARDIITSEWYQKTFKPEWGIRRDINSKGLYSNTAHGSRKAYFIGSRFKTGWRGRGRVLDDPLSAEDRYNKRMKDTVEDSWEKTMSSRVNDPRNAYSIIMMQRLADDDLVGRLLNKHLTKYVYLMLPTEYDPDRHCSTPIGEDHRKGMPAGTLLFPQMYNRETVEDLRITLGEVDYQAQYNHNPVPIGGTRFNSADFLYWKYVSGDGDTIEITDKHGCKEIVLLSRCQTFVSVDVAVSKDQQNDYTVYLVWALTNKNQMILLERYKERLSEPESINLAKKIYEFRRRGTIPHSCFYVEQNGVGNSLYQNMEEAGLPVYPINVHTDLFARSATAAIRIKSGQIYFPAPGIVPWLNDFETELTNFPASGHDDQVSSLSIAAIAIFDMAAFISGHVKKPPNGTIEAANVITQRVDLSRRRLFGVDRNKKTR